MVYYLFYLGELSLIQSKASFLCSLKIALEIKLITNIKKFVIILVLHSFDVKYVLKLPIEKRRK